MKKLIASFVMLILSASLGLSLVDGVNPTGMSGTVVDEYGFPIVGATVMAAPMLGTATDLMGHFVLYCPPKISYEVEISYVGYITDYVTVPVILEKMTQVSVELKEDMGDE